MKFRTHYNVSTKSSAKLAIITGLVSTGLAISSMAGTSSAASTPNQLNVLTAAGFKGGSVYLPGAEGPYPCILVLHGSVGGLAGWNHVKAVMFAAHGFAAMPLNYSRGGSGWRAGDIVDVDLDDTETALNWMRNNDTFECTKVGIFGASRGAEHALLLTSLLAAEGSSSQPDAVAAHAPAEAIWGAFYADRMKSDGTYDSRGQSPFQDRAWRWRGSYDQVEPDSRTKIERYAGPIFLSHGEDDDVWSVSNTRRMEQLLKGAGRTPEVHYYTGQGHVLDATTKNHFYEELFVFFDRHLSW